MSKWQTVTLEDLGRALALPAPKIPTPRRPTAPTLMGGSRQECSELVGALVIFATYPGPTQFHLGLVTATTGDRRVIVECFTEDDDLVPFTVAPLQIVERNGSFTRHAAGWHWTGGNR